MSNHIGGDAHGRKIGHVPKFMSQCLYHFLRHGGTVTGRVTGNREYSFDLPQGGLQVPVNYCFEGNKRVIDVLKVNLLRLIQENMIA